MDKKYLHKLVMFNKFIKTFRPNLCEQQHVYKSNLCKLLYMFFLVCRLFYFTYCLFLLLFL